MIQMEQNEKSEPKFRLNIKQTAKKELYWDITVKGDDIEQLTIDLENLKRLANLQTGQQNEGVKEDE